VTGGETLGWILVYPNGSTTPQDAPFLSVTDAKVAQREASGSTIRRLVRQS
jgi:hypothetical protein